jgi:hypothetical protein
VRVATIADLAADPGEGGKRLVRHECRRGASCERVLDEVRAAADRDEGVPGDDPT